METKPIFYLLDTTCSQMI